MRRGKNWALLWCPSQLQVIYLPHPTLSSAPPRQKHDTEIVLTLGQIEFPGRAHPPLPRHTTSLTDRKGIGVEIYSLIKGKLQDIRVFYFPSSNYLSASPTNLGALWVGDCILIVSGSLLKNPDSSRTSPLPFQAISNPNRHLKRQNRYPRFHLLLIPVRSS